MDGEAAAALFLDLEGDRFIPNCVSLCVVSGDVSLDGREGLGLRRHCEGVVGCELGCNVFCVRY